MPEPKAQLIDPQGPIDVPGLSVTGVTTATGGFVGQVQGAATGLASTTANLSVGIVTATKFQGNTTGNVSGLADDTNINVGIITSTSFTGDLVGNAAGLSTTTANIKAGIMSATSFAGNFTGVASGITGTPNIVVGIMTGTLKGDGSGLTGIAATNWIANNVNATTSTTTVDLSDGNVVKFTQNVDTTVSFANTGTSNIVSFIRNMNESFATGGVTFDGNGDSLSLASTSDFDFGTDDFTIELWAKVNRYLDTPYFFDFRDDGSVGGTTNRIIWYFNGDYGQSIFHKNGSAQITASDGVTLGKWNHYALVRYSSNTTMYINGISQGSVSDSTDYGSGGSPVSIGQRQGSYSSTSFNGVLSNIRIVKGTALYTSSFRPPFYELTNVTNTKLLCCQDSSSTTVGAVKPGTITANGDPTAGSQTVASFGNTVGGSGLSITWPSTIKWNGGSAPTLNTGPYPSDANVITLLTRDEGVTWYGWENISSKGGYQLWAWGGGNHGVLARINNSDTQYSSPIQIPGNWRSITQGSAPGMTAVLATKPDGTLWGWGVNGNGQLGQNTDGAGGGPSNAGFSSPVQIPGTTWTTVLTTKDFVLTTKTDGTLWAWGYNNNGMLAQNNRTDYSSPVQIPGTTWPTSGETKIKGEGAAGAVKTDGTLWMWGANSGGELGQNSITPGGISSPVQIPGTTWSKIGGGGQSMALRTNNSLFVWGGNYYGSLGLNEGPGGPGWHENVKFRSSPTQLPGTWKEISGNNFCASGIKVDGTLWAWGSNSYGFCGQNNRTNYSSPVQVPGTTWSKLKSGTGFIMASKTDNTLWAWGYTDYGVMGINEGPGKYYSSPVQVPGTDWINEDYSFALGSWNAFVLKNP